MQRAGEHSRGQELKAGWLGFSASVASGVGGLLIGRCTIVIHAGVSVG